MNEHKTAFLFLDDGSVSSVESTRLVSASYFYPFTQYQLAVLRDTPGVILNLDKTINTRPAANTIKPKAKPSGLITFTIIFSDTNGLKCWMDKKPNIWVHHRSEKIAKLMPWAKGAGEEVCR